MQGMTLRPHTQPQVGGLAKGQHTGDNKNTSSGISGVQIFPLCLLCDLKLVKWPFCAFLSY